MSNLPVLGSLSVGSSLERRTTKQIAQARSGGSITSAAGIAKVEAVAQVTEAALLATSHVSSIEALLISRTPHAEARIRHIADAGCAGMANIVLRAGSW